MRVAVYYRVSTKGQGEDDRFGLPAQRDAIERYCAERGHEIVQIFEDVGYSGATADRPGLAALLVAEAIEGVIAYAWDRYARDVMLDGWIRHELQGRGIQCLSATQENGEDPTSKLVQNILASVGEFERHVIAQRLAGGRKAKAKRGGYAHGRPPFGMRTKGGSLEPNDAEIAALDLMRDLRKSGRTYAEIAIELNARGLQPRHGSRWRTSSVHYVLTSQPAA